ncbi:MAG: DUF2497 domain-containing protein [Pseudomonadota bacterium]
MAKASATSEPSMEEILASIRQIISDDDVKDGEDEAEAPADEDTDESISEADLDALFASGDEAEEAEEPQEEPEVEAVAEEPAEPEEEPSDDADDGDDEDVLDLGALPQAADELFEAPEDLDFAEVDLNEVEEESAPTEEPAPAEEPAPVEEPVVEAAIESEPVKADAAANGIMSNDASNSVSVAFADLASTMLSANARTLEDLVQDMLRPMLKSWLDENLPTMVEKLVREEIERVARRGPRG